MSEEQAQSGLSRTGRWFAAGRVRLNRPALTTDVVRSKVVRMRRKPAGLLAGILAAAGAHLWAGGLTGVPACPASGTLASLIALSAIGCTINGLTYYGFTWSADSDNTVSVTPSEINYTANNSTGLLEFFSSDFSVSGSNTLDYTLEYDIDPPPVIIRMNQTLFPDPPTGAGTASLPTTICLGYVFVGNACAGATVSLLTFDDGSGASQLFDSVSFTPQSLIGVRTEIELSANGASSGIAGFSNEINAPEPSGYLLLGLGLMILLRKRARFDSISLRTSD